MVDLILVKDESLDFFLGTGIGEGAHDLESTGGVGENAYKNGEEKNSQ